MLPRKCFENLDGVIAILVFFVQFLRKIFYKFLPLILSPSPDMMQWYTMFAHFGLCLLGVRINVIEEIQNYGKIVFIKNIVEKWLVEGQDAYPSTPPLPDLPLLISSLN